MSKMKDREIDNLTNMLNESRQTIYLKDIELERVSEDYIHYVEATTYIAIVEPVQIDQSLPSHTPGHPSFSGPSNLSHEDVFWATLVLEPEPSWLLPNKPEYTPSTPPRDEKEFSFYPESSNHMA